MHDPLAALETQLQLLVHQYQRLRTAPEPLVYEVAVTIRCIDGIVTHLVALPDYDAPSLAALLLNLRMQRADLMVLLALLDPEQVLDGVREEQLDGPAGGGLPPETPMGYASDATFYAAMQARLDYPEG